MFKYIKTIHSHTVAETSRIPINNNIEVFKGTLCQISNGKLYHTAATDKALYLVIEEKKAEDGKLALDCIRLLPGMMLMATFDPESVSLTVGSNCGYTTDMNEHYTTLIGTGTFAEVVDIEGNVATIIIN